MWPETDFLSQLIRFTILEHRKVEEEKKLVTVCFSLIFDFVVNTTSNQNYSLTFLNLHYLSVGYIIFGLYLFYVSSTYLSSSWMQSKINTPDGATISNPHCEANLIMILCKSP